MRNNIVELMQQISCGVYVIGVSDGLEENAFTASWVMQVSFEPLLLAFSINSKHYSYQLLKKGGICSINVLSQAQQNEAEFFSRSHNKCKMKSHQWQKIKTGAPILMNSSAYFDCKVSHYSEAGDHEIVICDVVEAEILKVAAPLLYVNTLDLDGGNKNYQ